MIVRKVTQNCIDIIKHFEGFYAKPYVCPAGYLTIGWGHVILRNESFSEINQEQAEDVLKMDVVKSEVSVCRLISVPLQDHHYDALVSFCFNLGGGALQRSTLRAKINRGEYEEAAEEFPRWCYAKGKKLNGLVSRRLVEQRLFMSE
jgi:lysozyme